MATETDEYAQVADQLQLLFPYADKTTSLAMYLRMEDGVSGGADTTDETANNNDGEIVLATRGSAYGKFDEGYNFNGANALVGVADDATLKPANITASLWFYVVSGDLGVQRCLLHKPFTSARDPHYQFHLSAMDTGAYPKTIWVHITVGGTRYSLGTLNTGFNYSAWNNIVFTYDGETTKIYLNGVYKNQDVNPSGNITGYATILSIGKRQLYGDQWWKGNIDEIKIYDEALDLPAIQALYNSGNQYKSAGNWISDAITNSDLIESVALTLSSGDGSNYIDKVEILDASDDSVISIADGTYSSTITLDSEFDTLVGTNINYKIKVYFVGTGSDSIALEQIDINYAAGLTIIRFDGEVYSNPADIQFKMGGEVFT